MTITTGANAREQYPLAFAELFAGAGMAAIGASEYFAPTFANDHSAMKAAAYKRNIGADHFMLCDVAKVDVKDIPGNPAMVWASSPCTDLSLAGNRAGLDGAGSGCFWHSVRLIRELGEDQRKPAVVVLENVTGLLTSKGGSDFAAAVGAYVEIGYSAVGALMIDAANFLPQSRPRMFLIGALKDCPDLIVPKPMAPFHPKALVTAHDALPAELKAAWRWWRLDAPPLRETSLIDILESDDAVAWDTAQQTRDVLESMNATHADRVDANRKTGQRAVGALYRRTRPDANGNKRPTFEARFDGMAGCIRTASGGSSIQRLIIIDGDRVRTRKLTAREAARLMGLPDSYRLPSNFTDAYSLAGDGVAVPAVRWLAKNLLAPLAVL